MRGAATQAMVGHRRGSRKINPSSGSACTMADGPLPFLSTSISGCRAHAFGKWLPSPAPRKPYADPHR